MQSDFVEFERQKPYLFAAGYALATSMMVAYTFPTPPPRFMDIYLVGIALVHARWHGGAALLLYVLSIVFGSWILPPRNSFQISEGYDVYRITSYSVTALVVMSVIESLKNKRPQ